MALQIPVADDTWPLVEACYQIVPEKDKQGRLTDRWDKTTTLFLPENASPHPGLILDKFCPHAQSHKKDKTIFLQAWRKMADGQPAEYAEALHTRRDALQNDLGKSVRTLDAAVAWRMAVGLGNPNPLETSLTLHPQYGLPLVPGSAVKGLVRHARLLHMGSLIGVFPLAADEWKTYGGRPTPLTRLERLLLADIEDARREELLRALQNESSVNQASLPAAFCRDFRRVFGATDAQGEIGFLDALPYPGWTYDVDVLSPHYGDYYAGNEPPADWLSPNPVAFLTVGQRSRFRFDLTGADDRLLDEAAGWLTQALTDFGIGAKTNAGLGELAIEQRDVEK